MKKNRLGVFSRESGPSTFGPFAIGCSVGSSVLLKQYNTILVSRRLEKILLVEPTKLTGQRLTHFQILTTIKMCQSLAYHCKIT